MARRAGVSRSTVSNILNGNDERFPASTRERVLAAAAELDYRPSPAGRALVSGRSDTVVLLLPHTTFGANLQSAVDQVVERTHQIGGNVVVRFASATPEMTVSAVQALRPLAVVDFGVLGVEDLARLEERGTIVVPSARRQDARDGTDGGIARLQAEALVKRGPRRIWFAALSDERADTYGPGRLRALRDYCAASDLPEPGVLSVSLTLAGATAALRTVLADPAPAGVACYNDDVALALLAAARETGVNVPNDLAVVGVDHTPVGQLWSPPLTTIDTGLPALVDALATDLRSLLEGRPTDSTTTSKLSPAVIVGGTT